MKSIFALVPALTVAVVALNCGGSSTSAIAAGSCNVDGDCKSIDELCRDHRCVNTSTRQVDQDAQAPVGDGGKAGKDGGKVVDGSAPDDPLDSCNVVELGTKRQPLILEIVLDGSGSMDSDNKWTAAVQGVGAFFDDVLAHPQPELAIGLLIFEDSKDPTQGLGPYPSSLDIAPQVVNQAHHTKLTQRMTTTTPGGGTPTYLALSGAYNLLKSFNVPSGSPLTGARKSVVLISDGVPQGGATEQAQCTSAATAALALPVPMGPISTFAVGVGPFPGSAFSYDAKFMSELSIAGATRASPACDPNTTNVANVCHIQITPGGLPVAQMQQLFSKAVHRARTAATGCELILDGATEFDPDRSRVSFVDSKGKAIKLVQGDPDGWDFDDPATPTRIIFSGTACDDLALGETVKVEACEP